MFHLPLILLGSGLASLGLGFFLSKRGGPGAMGVDLPSAKAADKASSSLPATPPDPNDGLRRGIPPELLAACQNLILNGSDPNGIDQMATMVDNLGYADLANALRMRAAELRAGVPVPAPIPDPLPNVPIPPPPPPVAPSFDPSLLPSGNPLLRQGSLGPAVVAWQQFLLSQGYSSVGTADGNFGPKTSAATIAFQQSAGISADGIVGPATIAAAKTLLTRVSGEVRIIGRNYVGADYPPGSYLTPNGKVLTPDVIAQIVEKANQLAGTFEFASSAPKSLSPGLMKYAPAISKAMQPKTTMTLVQRPLGTVSSAPKTSASLYNQWQTAVRMNLPASVQTSLKNQYLTLKAQGK